MASPRQQSSPTEQVACRLQLFIAGMTPHSTQAVIGLRAVCARLLRSSFELRVIDVYQEHTLATAQEVLAVPTLIVSAKTASRVVGLLSEARVASALKAAGVAAKDFQADAVTVAR
ncbi:MAG TPA: circadian clock KaiB family protein [Candidatus Binataceae bacterium]|nr:circadian clock KaiB family protein [Candidatus Binataceae bacterium]